MLKYNLIFLLGLFVISNAWTQIDKTDAEDLFENLIPIGLNFSIQHGSWEKGGKGNNL